MTVPEMVGNENGIRLWNIMSTSDDTEEQAYFARLNAAAGKYGRVWFSDCVTQRETKQNQVTWMMTWDGIKWQVSIFLTPSGAIEVTERMKQPETQEVEEVGEVVELDIDDLLVDEE